MTRARLLEALTVLGIILAFVALMGVVGHMEVGGR